MKKYMILSILMLVGGYGHAAEDINKNRLPNQAGTNFGGKESAKGFNASSQGDSQSCEKAVTIYAKLLIGENDESLKIKKGKKVSGHCDGETCSVDSQKFTIQYNYNGSKGETKLTAWGPDTAKRCTLYLD